MDSVVLAFTKYSTGSNRTHTLVWKVNKHHILHILKRAGFAWPFLKFETEHLGSKYTAGDNPFFILYSMEV